MKQKQKVFLAMVSAVLLVAMSVLGTLAYLTDKDDIKNTFTVGQVYIKLDEEIVDEMGKPTGEGRTEDAISIISCPVIPIRKTRQSPLKLTVKKLLSE